MKVPSRLIAAFTLALMTLSTATPAAAQARKDSAILGIPPGLDSVNAYRFQFPMVSNKKLKGLRSSSPIAANDLASVGWQ